MGARVEAMRFWPECVALFVLSRAMRLQWRTSKLKRIHKRCKRRHNLSPEVRVGFSPQQFMPDAVDLEQGMAPRQQRQRRLELFQRREGITRTMHKHHGRAQPGPVRGAQL